MRRRRELVAALGAALAAGLAGCTEGDDGDGTTESVGETADDGTPESTGGTTEEPDGEEGNSRDYGDDPIPDGIESDPLPERGSEAYLADVETREHGEPTHVSKSADLEYEEHPPTGGEHYSDIVAPGVYDERQSLGELVHNLEHGHVVIYYDPEAITGAARESLERFAENNDDFWAAVVVVPNTRADPQADYVLTAWGARLAMDGYDARVVREFLAEYLGRGPENPVRRVDGR